MRLEEELKCNGLHGFGAGYALGKVNTPMTQRISGKDSYCANGCQIARECWLRHQKKCQMMMPRATLLIDGLCVKFGQLKAMSIFRSLAQDINKRYPFMVQKMPEKDPYLLQMMANLEDGYEYAKTGKVKPRGEFTLHYPRTDA